MPPYLNPLEYETLKIFLFYDSKENQFTNRIFWDDKYSSNT